MTDNDATNHRLSGAIVPTTATGFATSATSCEGPRRFAVRRQPSVGDGAKCHVKLGSDEAQQQTTQLPRNSIRPLPVVPCASACCQEHPSSTNASVSGEDGSSLQRDSANAMRLTKLFDVRIVEVFDNSDDSRSSSIADWPLVRDVDSA